MKRKTSRPSTSRVPAAAVASPFRTGGSDRTITIVIGIAGILLAAVAFHRISGFTFLAWDDHFHVIENPAVHPPTWSGVVRAWTRQIGNLYIPVSYTFFAAEAWLARWSNPDGPLRATPFRAGSLLLHGCTVVLVFILLQHIIPGRPSIYLGCAVFALHPIQVEAVAWISETRGLLSTLFAFVTLAIWLIRLRPTSGDATSVNTPLAASRFWWGYAAATMAFLLAILAKPSAAALPLVVLIIDRVILNRPLRQSIALVAPWMIVIVALLAFTRSLQPLRDPSLALPIWSQPLIAGDAISFYLRKLVWPVLLGPDYGRTPDVVLNSPTIWLTGTVPWLILLAGCIGRVPRALRCGIWLFPAFLLPVLGFIPFDHQSISTTADRYVYPAMLGVALVVSALTLRWSLRAVLVLLFPLTIGMAIVSGRQLAHWENDETLFRHALRVHPESSLAHNNLGFWLVERGLVDEGVAHYERALELRPDFHVAWVNLGVRRELAGRYDEAERMYRAALDAKPDYATAYANLANLLSHQGRYDEAVEFAARSAELSPDAAEWQYNYGVILTHLGRLSEAIERYEFALALKPDHAAAAKNLQIVRDVIASGESK